MRLKLMISINSIKNTLTNSIKNERYIEYLDYITLCINNESCINNEDLLEVRIFNEKKINLLKNRILKYRKLGKVSEYKLSNLSRDFEKAVVETISKEEYLRRTRKQKIKKINERNNN